ncbi:hypothetical protein Poly24_32450 [Rosistilla carotiformis]|uniref:Glycosyl transferase family 2 n=1 Tax=Rosistilla carotiformis TaxID=2528017 RepID=A0A518JVH4_9BACT|nr:hypothetical protein [Rosistilla carotiformis]QDV69529.1 hypothetical protein Poly24_32450 [Rosistilla carotiformis]
MIRLFTSYYPEVNRRRREEINECLRRNLAEDVIGEVCLFLENTDSPQQHNKLRTRTIHSRPLYKDFFVWARELCGGDSNTVVICNSDIYFDSSLAALGRQLLPGQCVALSRWNVRAGGSPALFDRNDAQDSWIFRGPPRDIVDDFPIGVPRCDNRMMYELRRAGYRVINPAFSVRSYHLHAGQREEYDQTNLSAFVDPPYQYIWPHNLCSLNRTLLYNLLHPSERIGWRMDWRWLRGTLPVRCLQNFASALTRTKGATDAA